MLYFIFTHLTLTFAFEIKTAFLCNKKRSLLQNLLCKFFAPENCERKKNLLKLGNLLVTALLFACNVLKRETLLCIAVSSLLVYL